MLYLFLKYRLYHYQEIYLIILLASRTIDHWQAYVLDDDDNDDEKARKLKQFMKLIDEI
jgi:hypothetical protein